MSIFSNLPEWNAQGSEPNQSKKDEGWQAGEKPPADWFNWLYNRSYESLKEVDSEITNINNEIDNIDTSGKVEGIVNVSTYGAVGDGVTDDTVAIQNAIDDAPERSIVFFPNGLYLINSSIQINKTLTLMSTGYDSGIKVNFGGIGLFFGNGTEVESYVSIKNMGFIGNQDSSTIGVFFKKCNYILVDSCLFRNFGDSGVVLDSCKENPKIINCTFDTTEGTFSSLGDVKGLEIKGYTHDIIISNNHFEALKTALYCHESSKLAVNFLIVNNNFDDNTVYAIDLAGPADININNNEFENMDSGATASINIDFTTTLNDYNLCCNINNNTFRDFEVDAVIITGGVGHQVNCNNYIGIGGSPLKTNYITGESYNLQFMLNAIEKGVFNRFASPVEITFGRSNISNNNFMFANAEAIKILDSPEGRAFDCIVNNNIIRLGNQSGTANSAIYTEGIKGIISDNRISGGNYTNSIEENSPADYNYIHDNLSEYSPVTSGLNTILNNNQSIESI